jgi:hypothetical protein
MMFILKRRNEKEENKISHQKNQVSSKIEKIVDVPLDSWNDDISKRIYEELRKKSNI